MYEVCILGGGISGLSALHFLLRHNPTLDVHLFEATGRLGGTIGTDYVDGFSFDWGPNGFLDREPLTLQMCYDLGLKARLERANPNVTNRFILRGGRLRSVPISPSAFLLSDILSVRGRLRVLLEPFASGPPDGVDESVFDFACRRIGREAAEYLVQPMVSGIYGGLAKRLSLQACFPIMAEMEKQYGSLARAMLAKRRLAGKSKGGPAGPGGWLTSIEKGLYGLIQQFVNLYRENISKNHKALAVSREDGSFIVRFENQEPVSARQIILAIPAYEAAALVRSLSPSLDSALTSIPYAPITVVCLGYRREQVKHPLDGFGFLVPQREQRQILGSIWTSSIFHDRASRNTVQLRTMLGGDGNHEVTKLSTEELIALSHAELRPIIGLHGDPIVTRVYRWQRGIPQFVVGHQQLISTVEKELSTLPNLFLTGNAYYGIGLNDCVKQSWRVAAQIALAGHR